MSEVAIVILNYNGVDFLRQFLPTVISHSQGAQIIVADNCSTDNSIQTLNLEFPDLAIIQIEKNLGYAGGYNTALSQVVADYYILLNSDVEVTQNWLEPMIAFLDKNEQYAAVQPKILDFNRKDHFEYAGAAGGFLDKWGYPYCRGRVFDEIEKDFGQHDQIMDIFWCSGACMVIRSKNFHSAGGFDNDFFAHMEEIDLCWRLKNQGHQLACIPQSTVYHVGGGTLNKSSPFKTYLNFRNNLCMLLKNLTWVGIFTIIPIRLLLDLAAGLKFWKDESFSHFRSIIKAQIDFIKFIPRNLNKRTPTIGQKEMKSLLLLDYYIRKKTTFNKINNTK